VVSAPFGTIIAPILPARGLPHAAIPVREDVKTESLATALVMGWTAVGNASLDVVAGPDLDDAGEQVALGTQSFAALGLQIPADFTTPGSRRQVIIDVGRGPVMFTVAAIDGADAVVHVGPAGRQRLLLESGPATPAHVTTDVLRSRELVETTTRRSDADMVAVAPHGGFIERATDMQARRVSSDERLLGDAWICRGRAGDAFRRWHITSEDLSEQSFPGLAALLATNYDHAVSFHGFDTHDGLDVVIGGRVDRSVKERIQQCLEPRLSALLRRPATVLVATSTRDPFPGLGRDNIVNRLARSGGLQIEQAAVVRSRRGAPGLVADIVSDVLSEQRQGPSRA
jgi:phage replication-related protein YjqB (UPF0714/DUF867 family)